MFYLSIIGTLASAIVLIFTAFFVFLKNRSGQTRLFYFLYNLTGAGIMFSIFLTFFFNDSPNVTYYSRLSQIFSILFSASLVTLALTYPEKEKKLPFYKAFLILFPAIIISTLIFFTNLSIYDVKFNNFVL